MKLHTALFMVSWLPLALPGCVTRSEHERALAEASERLRATQEGAAHEQATLQSEISKLNGEIKRLESALQQREEALSQSAASAAELTKKLDDATALNQQLRAELEKLGKNVDKLLQEKGSLNEALVGTKARLEELRKAQAAADQRAALFRSLLLKFKNMIDAGDLEIVLRDGRMVLQLRNDVLFDSGKVTLKEEGEDALSDVAGVLITFTDRKLQVAGHTDNVPISTQRFPSNWELSTARALNVVHFLIAQGVSAELLSAAGYGEHDPVAENSSADGKAKNRRIEIVLQPNIAELVQVPDAAP